MGADLIVDVACEPKRVFGNGDVRQGTIAILERLKADARASAIEQSALRSGKNPAEVEITLVVMGPDGPKETKATLAELKAQAAPLGRVAARCVGCPARMRDTSFGCYGYVNYPLPAKAEQWLIDRVEPVTSLGGWLCVKAMKDFQYDGAPIQRMRQRKILEAPRGLEKVMEKGWFTSTKVTTDQLLQAVLCVGPIAPAHGMGVLLWLGALALDGKVPPKPDPAVLKALVGFGDVQTRSRRTSLVLGDVPPEAAGLAELLQTLYRGYVEGVDVLVDS